MYYTAILHYFIRGDSTKFAAAAAFAEAFFARGGDGMTVRFYSNAASVGRRNAVGARLPKRGLEGGSGMPLVVESSGFPQLLLDRWTTR